MKRILDEIIAFFLAPLIYLGVSIIASAIWLGLSGLIVILSPYLALKKIWNRVMKDESRRI